MKSPIQKRAHIIKEVELTSLTFQSEPHCGHETFGLGGKLAKEMAFIFFFFFEQAHFFMFSGSLVFLFMKLLYFTA